MARPNPEILLKGYLDKLNYRNKDLVLRELQPVFQKYNQLVPNEEKHYFETGNHEDLIVIFGTIPVPFKGHKYNIPVKFWLPQEYPFHPPMCYVTPTQDMLIKPSQTVDPNGRISVTYMDEWDYPSSELSVLIELFIMAFSELPPVYKKPASNYLPYPIASPGYPGYPPQPSSQQPHYQYSPNYPVPNYPSSASGYPPPPPPGYSGPSGYPGGGYLPRAQGYPPSPSGYPPSPSGYAQSPTGYPPSPSGYPQGPTGYPPSPSGYPPTMNSSRFGPPPERPHPPEGYNPPSGEDPGMPPYAEPASFTSQASVESTGSIGQEHIKASILSAVEDKTRRKCFEEFSTLKAELASLQKTGDDLARVKTKLEEVMQIENQMDDDIQLLEESVEKLAEADDQLENQELSVDDAIKTTAPLYSQMLTTFCEDLALEDVKYVLAKGLNRGVVDLDTYLRQVRHLSRKQFMLRAINVKCREKAGLQPV